jgi:hypothetical protein
MIVQRCGRVRMRRGSGLRILCRGGFKGNIRGDEKNGGQYDDGDESSHGTW